MIDWIALVPVGVRTISFIKVQSLFVLFNLIAHLDLFEMRGRVYVFRRDVAVRDQGKQNLNRQPQSEHMGCVQGSARILSMGMWTKDASFPT